VVRSLCGREEGKEAAAIVVVKERRECLAVCQVECRLFNFGEQNVLCNGT
jgi:hypothetical protein